MASCRHTHSPKSARGHVERLLGGVHVGRHQQQPALPVRPAERVVLAEHPPAQVRDHPADLQPGGARGDGAGHPGHLGQLRPRGERGHAVHRGGGPRRPVDHVGRQQRQAVTEPGDLADVPLGDGGVGAQPGDQLDGLGPAGRPGPGCISRAAVRLASSQSTGSPRSAARSGRVSSIAFGTRPTLRTVGDRGSARDRLSGSRSGSARRPWRPAAGGRPAGLGPVGHQREDQQPAVGVGHHPGEAAHRR